MVRNLRTEKRCAQQIIKSCTGCVIHCRRRLANHHFLWPELSKLQDPMLYKVSSALLASLQMGAFMAGLVASALN